MIVDIMGSRQGGVNHSTMLTLSSLQLSDTQKYNLSFFSTLKPKLIVEPVSVFLKKLICPYWGLTVRVTVSPSLQYHEVYCSLTDESGDQLYPSYEIWKVPWGAVDQNLNRFSSARLRMATPTATHPLMPSILNLMLFFCWPMLGSTSTISVCSFSGRSGILTRLGSTSLSEGCPSVGEKRQNLPKSAFGFSRLSTSSQRLSLFFPPASFSRSSLQSSPTSALTCFRMPLPASRSSSVIEEQSSASEHSRSKARTKSTSFLRWGA